MMLFPSLMPNEETKQLSQSSCKPCGQRFLYVLGISGIFALNLLHMKRLQPDIAVEDDSEQVWIAKYRAAISEPPPKPLFKEMHFLNKHSQRVTFFLPLYPVLAS